jgi:TonB family protein
MLLLALCVSIGAPSASFAQKASKVGRKVVTRVMPNYPSLLKVRHIEGQVRLTAVVLPNGDVASVTVRGGNPILVETAVTAVKQWKYAPGAAQTEEDVNLDFGRW